MKLMINDEEMTTQATTLAELAEELNLPGSGIAIAVNNSMVPRSNWQEYALSEGINVTIIRAACGG